MSIVFELVVFGREVSSSIMLLTKAPLPLVVGEVRVLFLWIELRLDLLLGLLSPPIRTSFDGLVADAATAAAATLLAASEAVEAVEAEAVAKTPEEAPIGNDFVTSEPTTFCFFSAIVLLCLEVIFEAEAAATEAEAELLLGSSVWHSSSSSSVT